MSLSTRTARPRETRAVPQAIPAPAPALSTTNAPVAPYWGDRVTFWFWVGCFFLMALINVLDALAGLFR